MQSRVVSRSAIAWVIALVLGGLALARAAGSQEKVPANPSSPRFLLVTRHCEKDPKGDPRDAGLSESGRKRAAALAKLVGSAGLRHVFTSEYKRARETAEALKGKDVQEHVIPAGDAAALNKALDELPPGETALVVGHSNTVPAIAAHFGYRVVSTADGKNDTLPEDEFGTLFVLTTAPKSPGAAPLRLHYGD